MLIKITTALLILIVTTGFLGCSDTFTQNDQIVAEAEYSNSDSSYSISSENVISDDFDIELVDSNKVIVRCFDHEAIFDIIELFENQFTDGFTYYNVDNKYTFIFQNKFLLTDFMNTEPQQNNNLKKLWIKPYCYCFSWKQFPLYRDYHFRTYCFRTRKGAKIFEAVLEITSAPIMLQLSKSNGTCAENY